MVMVTVIASLLHGEMELKVERTLHRRTIKIKKIITHYLTSATCFPSAPDDSSVFFFYSQRLGITISPYVAMVTGLALSSSGEELVFCTHWGLNSCWTQWPADMEQQLPALHRGRRICLPACVCGRVLRRTTLKCEISPQDSVTHFSRCGERALMLPPRGGSRRGLKV